MSRECVEAKETRRTMLAHLRDNVMDLLTMSAPCATASLCGVTPPVGDDLTHDCVEANEIQGNILGSVRESRWAFSHCMHCVRLRAFAVMLHDDLTLACVGAKEFDEKPWRDVRESRSAHVEPPD